jgi:F0F1-type ATP synthase membrane subunit b/b'
MNLFIGVIMNSMQESQDEIKNALVKNNSSKSASQKLLADLEDKIDGLKLDIQKLNESLKNKNYG